MNNSYAYAEVLEVLANMDEIYVQKVPIKFINFLKENASKDYQKHIITSKSLDDQQLNPETLNILALINLKYWVESEEHKKELLAQYKENEKKKFERLSQHFDTSTMFDKSEAEISKSSINSEKHLNSSEIESQNLENSDIKNTNLPVEKKSIFRRIIEYFKGKIFEN